MKTLVSVLLCLALVGGLVAPAGACGITHAFVGTHFNSFAFVTPFVPSVAVTSFVPSVVAAPAVVSSPAVAATASCPAAVVATPAVVAATPTVVAAAVPLVSTAIVATPFIVRERFISHRAVVVNAGRAAVVVGRGPRKVVQRSVVRARR